MVPQHVDALRSLHSIWIDAGTRDQWYLDIGAQAFRQALADAGVADDVVRFELFDATHTAIEYRYPLALAWLCHRIADSARSRRSGTYLGGPEAPPPSRKR